MRGASIIKENDEDERRDRGNEDPLEVGVRGRIS